MSNYTINFVLGMGRVIADGDRVVCTVEQAVDSFKLISCVNEEYREHVKKHGIPKDMSDTGNEFVENKLFISVPLLKTINAKIFDRTEDSTGR